MRVFLFQDQYIELVDNGAIFRLPCNVFLIPLKPNLLSFSHDANRTNSLCEKAFNRPFVFAN